MDVNLGSTRHLRVLVLMSLIRDTDLRWVELLNLIGGSLRKLQELSLLYQVLWGKLFLLLLPPREVFSIFSCLHILELLLEHLIHDFEMNAMASWWLGDKCLARVVLLTESFCSTFRRFHVSSQSIIRSLSITWNIDIICGGLLMWNRRSLWWEMP